jgi:hypothetical protein
MKAFKKVEEFREVVNGYLDQMIEEFKEEGFSLEELDCLDEDLGFLFQSALEDSDLA